MCERQGTLTPAGNLKPAAFVITVMRVCFFLFSLFLSFFFFAACAQSATPCIYAVSFQACHIQIQILFVGKDSEGVNVCLNTHTHTHTGARTLPEDSSLI